jgi:hypothetical protein
MTEDPVPFPASIQRQELMAIDAGTEPNLRNIKAEYQGIYGWTDAARADTLP